MREYFAILILLFSQISYGQNLLKDGDFEIYDKCPQGIVGFPKDLQLTYWISANNATPDYFNSCSKNRKSSVPKNMLGFQEPKSGKGYVRCIFKEKWAEYIKTELSNELEKGAEYYLEFWVSLQDKSMYSVSRIGAFFGVNGERGKGSKCFELIPHVKTDEFITDSKGWTKISGVYKASGDEKFLTIGYFPFGTYKKTTKFNRLSFPDAASYYIDAVKLVKVDNEETEGVGLKKSSFKSNQILIRVSRDNGIYIEDKLVEEEGIVSRVNYLLSQVPNKDDAEKINFKIEADTNVLMRIISDIRDILK